MGTIPTYSGSSSPSPVSSTSAGTPGTFAGASSGNSITDQLTSIQIQLKNLTPAQFFAAYGISSTSQAMYLDGSGGLNDNAVYLAYYQSLNQQERQQIQSQMAVVGAISPSAASGLNTSSTRTAFESLIGTTAAQGTNVLDYLAKNASGTNAIQNQISANLTKAQENATTPIIATVENPTTLSADITSAFENALGYSPDQAQISSFINQVQGQDTSYAEAPRTEAQDQINQAHSEESALNKLGPDGIDTVIQAYQAAVTGTKLPGAGTPQGPVNGATPIPGQTNDIAPGTQLKPGDALAYTPQGAQVGMNLLPTKETTEVPGPQTGVMGFLNKITGNHTGQLDKETRYAQRGGGTAPFAPAGTPNTTPTYGGTYALSAADWKKAQSDYAPAKKYATPGSAPQSVQLAAFSSLLTSSYDTNGGSWSKAVASIASGSPFGSAEGTHLSAFGNQVAAEVNSQITALQNQVNNDTVTTKVSQPDAVAEADLAAKQSDPTGYYAAQSASWGEVLNKMLSGTPDMYNQSTSDTFTGPVASEAETGATAPTTVGAGAP